jgi:hypothetical protein
MKRAFPIAAIALTFACRDASAPNPGSQTPGAAEPQAGQPPPGQPPPGQPPLPPPAERVAQIQIVAPPATMHPVNATFGGGAVRYLGYEIQPAQPIPGQHFEIIHYWRAEKPIPEDWTIFVHFGIPGQPGMVANGDHIPAAGAYPTSQWKVGAAFKDPQVFGLPPSFPAPQIEVYVGLYQGDKRMPLDPPARGPEDRLLAAKITLASATNQAPLPTYKAPRRKGPITVDGVLDEADWKNAPSTAPFVSSMDGSKTKYLTQAKLLWDDQFLYVAFTCEDQDVWSDFTKHDDKLYTQEAVELFVDADGDGKTYNELEIAPTNATFDAYFPARRQGMDLSWESGMTSAVKVDGTLNNPNDIDKGWTAEAKIPLKSFAAVPHLPPRPGDKWRINLYRLDWHTNRKINEGSAFSPLYQGDFHNLPRFGWLEFGS